jgi:2-oxoisovalerate dehydrogenase E1 component
MGCKDPVENYRSLKENGILTDEFDTTLRSEIKKKSMRVWLMHKPEIERISEELNDVFKNI